MVLLSFTLYITASIQNPQPLLQTKYNDIYSITQTDRWGPYTEATHKTPKENIHFAVLFTLCKINWLNFQKGLFSDAIGVFQIFKCVIIRVALRSEVEQGTGRGEGREEKIGLQVTLEDLPEISYWHGFSGWQKRGKQHGHFNIQSQRTVGIRKL